MANNIDRKNCVLGRAALFAMTLIWGTSFVVLKEALNTVPTLYLLAFRFSGAAVLMLLLGIKDLKKLDLGYLKYGVLLGVFLFLAYTVQTFGMEYTTPAKNAFLTTTYCVLVPFIDWAIEKKRPDGYNFIAAVVCLAGVGFVSLQSDLSVNIGDLLTICCGVFFALHIIATGRHIKGRSVALLTMVQFATAGILAWGSALMTTPMPQNVSTETVWRIVYLCVMCTAVCFVLQTYGQKYTPPSTVAVIMTLESVFGAAFSVMLGYEVLTARLAAGFVLIFLAVLMSETKFSFLRRKRRKKALLPADAKAAE